MFFEVFSDLLQPSLLLNTLTPKDLKNFLTPIAACKDTTPLPLKPNVSESIFKHFIKP